MKFKMVFAAVVGWYLLGSLGFAATQAQIDQSWNKGLAWTMINQHSDGGWSDAAGLGPQTTSEMLVALASVNLKATYTYLGGISWLSNAEPASIDALAHQTQALKTSGEVLGAFSAKLVAWQNVTKGWGAYPQYGSSLPDTPLAIMALMDAKGTGYSNSDITAAVCEFLPAQLQSPSYLWPYAVSTGAIVPPGQRSGAIIPTVYAIQALQKINTTAGRFTGASCGGTAYTFTTVINNAINGLLLSRKSDNGFGDGTDSTVLETALVYRVLKVLRPTDAATTSALDYLIAQQAGDGSWGDDSFFTASVLASLPTPTALVDTDKDGIPDGVEVILGKNPNIADSRFLAIGSSPEVTAPAMQTASALNSLLASKNSAPATVGATEAKTGDKSKVIPFLNEPINIEIFIAGSSAQLNVLEATIQSLFDKDIPIETFYDDGGGSEITQGSNFRAYLGMVGTTKTGLLDGKRVLIHFRSEGGSYNGVGPVALSIGIERMIIDESCVVSGNHTWSCPLANTVIAVPDAGISEVKPAWHINQNVPRDAIAPTPDDINKLDIEPLFKGYYGVAATQALLNMGLARVKREKVSTLLAGLETTGWSGINSSLPPKPVIICRMTDGAQPAANALFFDIPFDPQAPLIGECDNLRSGLLVIEKSSLDDVANCLNTANNGGILTFSNPARHVQVPKKSFAIGVLPTSYRPGKTDKWGYLSITPSSGQSISKNASGADSLYMISWMQWRKSGVSDITATTKNTLALLKEIRTRMQDPEMLKNLPGVKALTESPSRTGKSSKGEKL